MTDKLSNKLNLELMKNCNFLFGEKATMAFSG